MDINYVHGSQNVKSPRRRQDQEWGDSTWNAPAKKEKPINKTRKVTQSPRPRGSTPRGKKKQSQYGAPALDPPWKGTEVAQAPQQPSTASNSQAEQHLQELLAVLETSENPLSADVQKVVEKTKQPLATAKSVRQAFHHLETKKEAIDGSAESQIQPASILEQLPGRLYQALAYLCRGFCKERRKPWRREYRRSKRP